MNLSEIVFFFNKQTDWRNKRTDRHICKQVGQKKTERKAGQTSRQTRQMGQTNKQTDKQASQSDSTDEQTDR